CQRLPGGHRTFVTVLRALWPPFAENSGRAADHDRAIIERSIFHDRSRIHSIFKRSRVNKRLHRCAGGTLSLQSTIVLIVFEIAATHEHENAADFVIDLDDWVLQMFRPGLARPSASGSR